MSEHEQRPSKDEETEREETVQDLEAPEEQAEDVTGGKALSDWYKQVNETGVENA
jgi:hypothetical protein